MVGFTDVQDPMAYINLRYTNTPLPRYVETELLDATIMLLADRNIVPSNVPKCLPRDLMKYVKQAVKPVVLASVPDQLSTDIKITGPRYTSIFKAPKLQKDSKIMSVVTLDVWPLFGDQGCKYKKSPEDMYEKEVHKFVAACQVLSDKYCYDNPNYRTPVIKAHSKAFLLRPKFLESKTVEGRLYIFVPKFVEEIAAKYCPEALCLMSMEAIESDSKIKQKMEMPDSW